MSNDSELNKVYLNRPLIQDQSLPVASKIICKFTWITLRSLPGEAQLLR